MVKRNWYFVPCMLLKDMTSEEAQREAGRLQSVLQKSGVAPFRLHLDDDLIPVITPEDEAEGGIRE